MTQDGGDEAKLGDFFRNVFALRRIAARRACLFIAALAVCMSAASEVRAADAAKKETEDRGLLYMIEAGGWVGHTILLLSVVAVALAIEQLLTIRRTTLMPPGLAERVRDALRAGQAAQADQLCKQHPSTLAHVMQAGISELDGGWTVVEKAMEDAMGEQSARLHRKAEYISVIANIAPMLGLLGTVMGMIEAFSQVAADGVADPKKLSTGIYLALVTTVEGLIVAIPALGVYALFRNRIDGFVAEVAYVAQHVFAPLRRAQVVRRAGPTPPPVAGPAASGS